MADETPTITPPPAVVPPVDPPPAADVVAQMQAKIDDLGRKLGAVSQEAAERRVAAAKANEEKAAADAAALEAKRAAGELGPVLEQREKDLAAARADLDRIKPLADRYAASAEKKKTANETALAEPGLPSVVKRGIEYALGKGDVEEAADLLEIHRASVAPGAPKQPAHPAPNSGGAPASPKPAKSPAEMSPAELENLRATDPDAYFRHVGGTPPGKSTSSILSWMSRRPG
jgi:hypothetical protein